MISDTGQAPSVSEDAPGPTCVLSIPALWKPGPLFSPWNYHSSSLSYWRMCIVIISFPLFITSRGGIREFIAPHRSVMRSGAHFLGRRKAKRAWRRSHRIEVAPHVPPKRNTNPMGVVMYPQERNSEEELRLVPGSWSRNGSLAASRLPARCSGSWETPRGP